MGWLILSYHASFYFSPLSLGGGWMLCLRPWWYVWVWGGNPWTRWDLEHIVGGEDGSQHILKVATLNSLLNASQCLTTIVPIMFSKLLSLMPFHHILNRCYITYYHFIILLNVLGVAIYRHLKVCIIFLHIREMINSRRLVCF